MTDVRIGRIVAAAVHQAVADHMPLRLEFYEHYLKPMRFRQASLGAASFAAALSFLRLEPGAYEPVVTRAGRYAADWTFASVPRLRRAVWRRLPRRFRLRAALRLARQIVAETAPEVRARAFVGDREGRLDINHSLFCEVRKPVEAPLCGYFASALNTLCRHLRVPADVRIVGCRATGHPHCLLALEALASDAMQGGTQHSSEVA
jgi:predicted hydrocarbon binding protein